MCKPNLIHVCFIIDESGSMYGSEKDVVGGFNKTIDEQKAIEGGECLVSYFKFSDNVQEMFVGRKLEDIKPMTVGGSKWADNYTVSNHTLVSTVNNVFDTVVDTISTSINGLFPDSNLAVKTDIVDTTFVYSPGGCTAMNDGIGTAIDKIGKWLSGMPEEERPSKNLIVIMTDGEENSSREYSLKKVQEMIQHQTEKYNWTFVYMGMDITSADCADKLGISNRSFSSKSSSDTYKNYDNISSAVKCYRMSDATAADEMMCMTLCSALSEMTTSYETKVGIKID